VCFECDWHQPLISSGTSLESWRLSSASDGYVSLRRKANCANDQDGLSSWLFRNATSIIQPRTPARDPMSISQRERSLPCLHAFLNAKSNWKKTKSSREEPGIQRTTHRSFHSTGWNRISCATEIAAPGSTPGALRLPRPEAERRRFLTRGGVSPALSGFRGFDSFGSALRF